MAGQSRLERLQDDLVDLERRQTPHMLAYADVTSAWQQLREAVRAAIEAEMVPPSGPQLADMVEVAARHTVGRPELHSAARLQAEHDRRAGGARR